MHKVYSNYPYSKPITFFINSFQSVLFSNLGFPISLKAQCHLLSEAILCRRNSITIKSHRSTSAFSIMRKIAIQLRVDILANSNQIQITQRCKGGSPND